MSSIFSSLPSPYNQPHPNPTNRRSMSLVSIPNAAFLFLLPHIVVAACHPPPTTHCNRTLPNPHETSLLHSSLFPILTIKFPLPRAQSPPTLQFLPFPSPPVQPSNVGDNHHLPIHPSLFPKLSLSRSVNRRLVPKLRPKFNNCRPIILSTSEES